MHTHIILCYQLIGDPCCPSWVTHKAAAAAGRPFARISATLSNSRRGLVLFARRATVVLRCPPLLVWVTIYDTYLGGAPDLRLHFTHSSIPTATHQKKQRKSAAIADVCTFVGCRLTSRRGFRIIYASIRRIAQMYIAPLNDDSLYGRNRFGLVYIYSIGLNHEIKSNIALTTRRRVRWHAGPNGTANSQGIHKDTTWYMFVWEYPI